MLKNNEGLFVSTRSPDKKIMINYERVSDEIRNAIPEKDRCAISYNGFHVWKLGKDKQVVICLKCLKTQKIDIDKVGK
jgi:hypothetical protein